MNQILVTEKLYITPELKQKKRRYQIRLFLSILLICIFCSYYIYAENERNKSEEVSQQLLAQMDNTESESKAKKDTTTRSAENDVIVVSLDEEESDSVQEKVTPTNRKVKDSDKGKVYYAENGEDYRIESRLQISNLGIDYPVLSKTSDELLKISLNKYWGNGPNKIGNYCIVGHNYANGKLFGKLSQMEIGDTAVLKDMETGKSVTYEAYKIDTVDPTDVSCTSQLTNGKKEMTLITCKNYGTQRLIIKCREL